MNEEEVLKLTIDPKKVSAEELDVYENLMKGQIAKARSNASYQAGSRDSPDTQKSLHIWNCSHKSSSKDQELGPMELIFDKPTSLVSLDINLTFETDKSQQLGA